MEDAGKQDPRPNGQIERKQPLVHRLKNSAVTTLRKHRILPQPAITTIPNKEIAEVREKLAAITPEAAGPERFDPSPTDLQTVSKEPLDPSLRDKTDTEPKTEDPIDRMVKYLQERLPERIFNPDSADSLDELFFSQLWENVNESDATSYLRQFGTGQPAYALPYEMRQYNGEYYPLIPRTRNWHFIRDLPVWGNHSPVGETLDKPNRFSRKLEEILKGKLGVSIPDSLAAYFNKNDPEVIGVSDGRRTPYHRMRLSEEGVNLELQTEPTIEQAGKLAQMRDRLSKIAPVTITIKKDNGVVPIAEPLDIAKEMPMNFIAFLENSYPHINQDRAVLVDLTDTNRVEISSSVATNSPMLYGYGYIDSQLREEGMHDVPKRQIVVFYFDETARRHDDSRSSFLLSRLAEQRYKANRSDTTAQDLRAQLPAIGEKSVLGDVWQERPELITDSLPFTLHVDELQIPCGFRATMNAETGELRVEVLADQESVSDPIKNILLQRSADKAAEYFKTKKDSLSLRSPRPEYPNRTVKIKSAIASILPVARMK